MCGVLTSGYCDPPAPAHACGPGADCSEKTCDNGDPCLTDDDCSTGQTCATRGVPGCFNGRCCTDGNWDGHKKLVGAIAGLQRDRIKAIGRGGLGETDHFQCVACARYFNKLDWLEEFPDNPWSRTAGKEEVSNEKTG